MIRCRRMTVTKQSQSWSTNDVCGLAVPFPSQLMAVA